MNFWGGYGINNRSDKDSSSLDHIDNDNVCMAHLLHGRMADPRVSAALAAFCLLGPGRKIVSDDSLFLYRAAPINVGHCS